VVEGQSQPPVTSLVFFHYRSTGGRRSPFQRPHNVPTSSRHVNAMRLYRVSYSRIKSNSVQASRLEDHEVSIYKILHLASEPGYV
jgi:hypothetical protein